VDSRQVVATGSLVAREFAPLAHAIPGGTAVREAGQA